MLARSLPVGAVHWPGVWGFRLSRCCYRVVFVSGVASSVSRSQKAICHVEAVRCKCLRCVIGCLSDCYIRSA